MHEKRIQQTRQSKQLVIEQHAREAAEKRCMKLEQKWQAAQSKAKSYAEENELTRDEK
ncbi:hypothetical protein KIN20_023283 [Parelaphostrongylus tenuis]|uniref:Uncharacterized protein n=1 Tax=Parelaphostrongylus tenuis TaxID=148309 RepID=A0AAD5QVY1_PARTN|nr:hypothetical protein KIN20_023283 [Parelaphostrongylus tenuis]